MVISHEQLISVTHVSWQAFYDVADYFMSSCFNLIVKKVILILQDYFLVYYWICLYSRSVWPTRRNVTWRKPVKLKDGDLESSGGVANKKGGNKSKRTIKKVTVIHVLQTQYGSYCCIEDMKHGTQTAALLHFLLLFVSLLFGMESLKIGFSVNQKTMSYFTSEQTGLLFELCS